MSHLTREFRYVFQGVFRQIRFDAYQASVSLQRKKNRAARAGVNAEVKSTLNASAALQGAAKDSGENPNRLHMGPKAGPGESDENGNSPDSPGIAIEEGRPQVKEPPKYAVILHNDDYTTMEFVIEVLQRYFHKPKEEAMEITLRVHHEGRGLAGIFTRQIAETKVAQVSEFSRSSGHPLKCTAEPV